MATVDDEAGRGRDEGERGRRTAPPYVRRFQPGEDVWYTAPLSGSTWPGVVQRMLSEHPDGTRPYIVAIARGDPGTRPRQVIAYHHELAPRDARLAPQPFHEHTGWIFWRTPVGKTERAQGSAQQPGRWEPGRREEPEPEPVGSSGPLTRLAYFDDDDVKY